MKKIFICILSLIICNKLSAQQLAPIKAAMGKVGLEFSLDATGSPVYAVNFGDKAVIKPSHMGIKLLDDSSFDTHFTILKTERKTVDETWEPVWGEVSHIRNHYEEVTVHLQQQNVPHRLMDIVFRVFADGVGFRYEFPVQPNLKYFIVSDELTEFSLTGDNKTFWIPGDYDSNDYPYTVSPISQVDASVLAKSATDIGVRYVPDKYGIQTPLMMKTADGLYINIHEAALQNYTSMQLHADTKTYKLTANLVGDAAGNKAYL